MTAPTSITSSSSSTIFENAVADCALAFLEDLAIEELQILFQLLNALKVLLNTEIALLTADLLRFDILAKTIAPIFALIESLVGELQNLPSLLPFSAFAACPQVQSIINNVEHFLLAPLHIPLLNKTVPNIEEVSQEVLDVLSGRAEVLLLQQTAQQMLNLIDSLENAINNSIAQRSSAPLKNLI